MTELHAGYRVPSEEMDEIPMDNYNRRAQSIRPTGEYQRRLDAESYWSFVGRHRVAVLMTVVFIAIVLAFVGVVAYLALSPAENYTEIEINKKTEVEYPVTEKAMVYELEDDLGVRSPIYNLQDESFDDVFDTLIRDTYKIIPIAADQAGRMKRVRRDVEEENVESCKKRHENCRVLLSKVKNMTKNVSEQVQELQRMINRLGIQNEQLPSLNNITALDFAICLRCEKLENETAELNNPEISPNTDSTPKNSQGQSKTENTRNYTDSNTEGIMNVTRKNISVVENPDGSESILKNVTTSSFPVPGDEDDSNNKTSDAFENAGSSASSNTSDLMNNYETNVPSQNNEDAVNVVDNAEANDGAHDFFFHHSQFNENSGSEYQQVEPDDVTEAAQQDNVPLSTTSSPQNDEQSTIPSSSVSQNYSPQGKANVELNPMIIPTAETSKGSLQVTYTPSISWMPYPLCIYGPPNPPAQLVRDQKSSDSITFPVSSPASSSSSSSQAQKIQQGQYLISPTSNGQTISYNLNNFVQPMMQPTQQGVQFLPTQFQPVLPQRFGPTGPGTQYFPFSPANHLPSPTAQGRPIYCSYMPTPTFQFPVVPGVSEYQRNVPDSEIILDSNPEDINDSDKLDEQQLKSRDYTAGCPPNTRICSDRSRCIPNSRWCDGAVDCSDASDEIRCSCRDRVDKDRLCDGYFDCPLGEDELGCFGCDRHSFSCDDSENRRRWGNCVPLVQRCDGQPQCANGKDELNCNIITQSVEEREMFTVGYTTGYLHRNWKGRWYPACTPSKTWANDACRAEIGDENYRDFPVVETVFIQQNYKGPYVVKLSPRKVEIVESCSGNAVFVNCAKMPCGTRVSSGQHDSPFDDSNSEQYPLNGLHGMMSDVLDNFRSDKEESNDQTNGTKGTLEDPTTYFNGELTSNVTNSANGSDPILTESRVVGGHPSQPRAWPSLVAINRDGNFHCGGVILDQIWILTAAHCIDGYRHHYYDIQSGILRRFSYSPMEQSRKVSHIIMYPGYDSEVMKNDIALLRLEKPLNFNRWVRPACLPEIMTAGPSWRTGPRAKTTCVSAGWGSTFEHGPDPDHLREVELPILPNCRHLEDQNEAEICAGSLQGGRDTCQGDSGGPLMCRNPNSPSQWYVAGIVSHGEGCARPNEPGAYTKVSRFVDWINEIRLSEQLPSQRPLQRCPGYYCHSGSRRCYPSKKRCDKSVDCMDAEDELNCRRFTNFFPFRQANSEDGYFVKSKPEDDPSWGMAKSNDETSTVTESTTAVSSAEASSTIEPSSTSTELTESIDRNSTTPKPVEILAVVTMSTTIEPTEETEQQSATTKPEENLTTVRTDQEISIIPTPEPPEHFSCRKLIQTIELSKRCDRIIDCEDGTDEEDCTCKDYLIKVSPDSICDGHIDCRDGTDEENCQICAVDEFHCKRSRECVPMDKRCNIKGDCEYNEDELGCSTLTNGKYVIIDIDGMPHHNTEGILTSYENGKWVPFCIDRRPNRPATLGKQMCSYFGFVGCESFNETRVENTPLEVLTSTSTNLIPYEYSSKYSSATDEEPRCTALYLRCLPTIHTVPLAYRLKAIAGHNDDTFLWPWHAAVFVDGRYKCGAVLLEPSWLLTSIYCTDNLDLSRNYTTALLGVSRSYLQVDGPHQQMSPVDEIKTVKNSDAVLLHLKYPANMTRQVQPMYLQKRTHAPAESDTCATVAVDKKGRTRTVFLKAVIHNCPDNHRCYKTAKDEKCENETMTSSSGTVVCFGCSGWYPAAVYHEEAGLCSFSKKRSLSSIDYINTNLITGMQEPLQPSSHEPKCNGYRCPLGNCIESRNVCDGVPDCRDGADEDGDYCREIEDHCENGVHDKIDCHCAQSELRCANGQCVEKSSFCDGKIDCIDGSDETPNCTCADYLKLTSPKKICDGRRHCIDKSDESPDLCYCKDASFKCDGNGDVCVPEDFVCDGEQDCSSGEDEKHCQTLMTLPSDPPGYGEVIERSYGVWHSRCFPAGALSDDKLSADQLCANFGYSYAKNITESDVGGRRNSPVVPKLDKFHMVRLNPRTWIVVRDDKALVSLHPPPETCYRHYVTCA